MSPIHCIVRAMKPYVSPDTRPVRHLPELVDEPFVEEDDLPADSFLSDTEDLVPHPVQEDTAPAAATPGINKPTG